MFCVLHFIAVFIGVGYDMIICMHLYIFHMEFLLELIIK